MVCGAATPLRAAVDGRGWIVTLVRAATGPPCATHRRFMTRSAHKG